MHGAERFPSDRRVRRASDFRRTQQAGGIFQSHHWLVRFVPNGEASSRLGLVVSKRVGNAVVRNRCKRLIREGFRVRKDRFPAVDLVVIARKGMLNASWSELEATWEKLIRYVNGKQDTR